MLKIKRYKMQFDKKFHIPVKFQIENAIISSVSRVKLLGGNVDGRLNCDYYLSHICKKASEKLLFLSRVPKYMDLNKRRMLVKAFLISQFSYCLLVRILHSRNTENRVNIQLWWNDNKKQINKHFSKEFSVPGQLSK